MRRTALIALVLALPLAACEMDNYSPPQSVLEGRLVYQGQPVSVRDNAIQLELWQDGYALRTQIAVHVSQEGTFTARLFDGDYKLVRKANNGPWANNSDTIHIQLRGAQTLDVPVSPFFVIQDPNIARTGTNLTGTFNVQQVAQGRNLERVALYVGRNRFVDQRFNAARVERNVTNTALNTGQTLSLDLASVAQGQDYVFARLGVKAVGVEELIYTPVQKIQVR